MYGFREGKGDGPMVVQPSVLNALTVWSMVVICGFLWRTAAGRWSDRPIGQAMAFVY